MHRRVGVLLLLLSLGFAVELRIHVRERKATATATRVVHCYALVVLRRKRCTRFIKSNRQSKGSILICVFGLI